MNAEDSGASQILQPDGGRPSISCGREAKEDRRMPFARVVHLQLQPGKAEEVIAYIRRALESEEPVPGRVSLHGLQNLQDRDAGMLVSFFQNRESMEANTVHLEADLAALQAFLASPPVVSVHEVVIEKRAAGSGS